MTSSIYASEALPETGYDTPRTVKNRHPITVEKLPLHGRTQCPLSTATRLGAVATCAR